MAKRTKLKVWVCRDGGCMTEINGDDIDDVVTCWAILGAEISRSLAVPIDVMLQIAKEAVEEFKEGST